MQPATNPEHASVLTVADLDPALLPDLAARYGLLFERVPDNDPVPGSFWGEPEAGIIANTVYARGDTPLHSVLHELCHVVCMTPARRAVLARDAGGDDAEECAVCYLQIVLADELAGIGSARLMQDMDAWGYSFRLGSTRNWFEQDAADARDWLRKESLLAANGKPLWRLRGAACGAAAAGTCTRAGEAAPDYL